MGMVDDVSVSHYFKRLTMIDMSLGDADFHLGRFSEMLRRPTLAPPRYRGAMPTPNGAGTSRARNGKLRYQNFVRNRDRRRFEERLGTHRFGRIETARQMRPGNSICPQGLPPIPTVHLSSGAPMPIRAFNIP